MPEGCRGAWLARFLPIFAAAVLTTTQAPPVLAQQLTAGELSSWCSSGDVDIRNLCRFYILGAFEGFDFGSSAIQIGSGGFVPKADPEICVPRDLGQSQMVTLFQNGVERLDRAHPEDLKAPAISVLAAVISRAFPCRHHNKSPR